MVVQAGQAIQGGEALLPEEPVLRQREGPHPHGQRLEHDLVRKRHAHRRRAVLPDEEVDRHGHEVPQQITRQRNLFLITLFEREWMERDPTQASDEVDDERHVLVLGRHTDHVRAALRRPKAATPSLSA